MKEWMFIAIITLCANNLGNVALQFRR